MQQLERGWGEGRRKGEKEKERERVCIVKCNMLITQGYNVTADAEIELPVT